MKKLLYVVLFVIGAAAFWRCDDPEWESGAVGTWGSPDLTLPIEGGTRTVKFSTTKAWSVSIEYPEGTDSRTWCAVAPMSGPAGDGSITISAGPNDSYEDRVAKVIVYSGSGSKVYTVMMPCQGEMSAEKRDFLDLPFAEQIIGVPILHNVGYEVSIPDDAKEWISKVDDSKAMPTVDTLYLKISEYRSGVITRKAVLTVFNKDKGYVEKINVSQLPGPSLSIAPEMAIDGNKQTVNIEMVSSESWTVTPDPKAPWCVLASAASGEKGNNVLKFSVEETKTQSRTATITVKADTMVRSIKIVQTELGIENGYYIMKGDIKGFSKPSLVKSNTDLYAVYTKPYSVSGDQVSLFASGSGVVGWKFDGKKIYLRVTFAGPVKSIMQSIRESDYGSGLISLNIYRWDKDKATTLASRPVLSNTVSYSGGKHYELMPKGTLFPAGECLIELGTTTVSNGEYWSWGKATAAVQEAWVDNLKMTEHFPEMYFFYETSVNGGPLAVAKTSSDQGKTWSDVSLSLYGAMFDGTSGSMPTSGVNFSLTAGPKYYYAVFDRATPNKGSVIARATSLSGKWELWNGETWGITGKAVVWTASNPISLVDKDGVYAYYMNGSDLVVNKHAASSNDAWPAQKQQESVGYTFSENTPVQIDVKFHATSNKFVATYITADRLIGTLTSTDGVTFTLGEALPLPDYYLWSGAEGVRYAVSAGTGAVEANSYISYSRTTGLYMFPAK